MIRRPLHPNGTFDGAHNHRYGPATRGWDHDALLEAPDLQARGALWVTISTAGGLLQFSQESSTVRAPGVRRFTDSQAAMLRLLWSQPMNGLTPKQAGRAALDVIAPFMPRN